jgi:hypothetical protein
MSKDPVFFKSPEMAKKFRCILNILNGLVGAAINIVQ